MSPYCYEIEGTVELLYSAGNFVVIRFSMQLQKVWVGLVNNPFREYDRLNTHKLLSNLSLKFGQRPGTKTIMDLQMYYCVLLILSKCCRGLHCTAALSS